MSLRCATAAAVGLSIISLCVIVRGAEYFDITQTVFDGDTDHKICYHYHGKLGQRIMIASDKELGFKVYAKYGSSKTISEMQICYTNTNITITPDSIAKNNLTNIKWLDRELKTDINGFTFTLNGQTIHINVEGKGRSLKMRVVRIAESDLSYLNFYFDLLNGKESVDEKIGGLLGLVSEHKFKFYPPVQMKTQRAAVQIDNVVVKAEFKRKRDYMCWFIDVLDFINEP
ncbi:DgyrCDS14361 [Dimorphilus gyrociliatus]|uniref:DgyrCDS14361 n=1 Tax=Dimorphilus gyrociliatus TaxID=2664684 RepID=A0A7I8WDD0_9ANNE|nr:DgyrCDS14361 [Dimorphilus gyrociliatus]